MNIFNQVWFRSLLVLVACFFVVYDSQAHPHLGKPTPKQVTDSQCTSAPADAISANLSAANLLPNPTLSDVNPDKPSRPTYWTPSSYGSNSSDYKYLESGHAGSKALEAIIYEYSSGAASWLFNNLPVTPGQQYYFSSYYKSDTYTQVEASFTMANGSTKYEILGFAEPSHDWKKLETTFTAPLGAQSFNIDQYLQGKGDLVTSDYSLRAYEPQGFNAPMLTLTFDDGYEDTYQYGLPLMQKYNIKSTQFIITDLIGANRYMIKPQLLNLIANGHEIASHTVTHNSLEAETNKQLQIELIRSKSQLKRMTNNKITDFAYPLGLHNSHIEQAVAEQYVAARGVEAGLNSKDNLNCLNLKAEDIHSDTTPEQITDWIKQAQATNTWLILVYHSVEPDKSSSIGQSLFNVTPRQLDTQLKAIKTSGIEVKTMAEALNQIYAETHPANSKDAGLVLNYNKNIPYIFKHE